MAYQTGIASDPWDLLTKLRTFALTLGWSAYADGAASEGNHIFLGLRDPGLSGYWAFIVPVAATQYNLIGGGSPEYMIDITCNTGNDSGADGYNQPGGHTGYGTRTNRLQGPYLSYDFFGDANYLHVVVQVAAAKFRHFGIGNIYNQSLLSDGQYAYGTVYGMSARFPGIENACPTNECRLPFGCDGGSDVYFSYDPGWFGFIKRSSVLRIGGNLYYFGLTGFLSPTYDSVLKAAGPGDGHLYGSQSKWPWYFSQKCSRSQFGQLVNLTPMNLMPRFVDAGFRKVGRVRDMAACRMSYIANREVLEIGGEQWMIVPASKYRSDPGAAAVGDESSWDLGYAYKMVT